MLLFSSCWWSKIKRAFFGSFQDNSQCRHDIIAFFDSQAGLANLIGLAGNSNVQVSLPYGVLC